jgi:ubiquinone/menaquinone biosynthesis C-methylase UbiE
VVGLDFSQGMLDQARSRVADVEGGVAVELVRGDARAMTFDAAFDVVTSVGAFGHLVGDDEDRFVAGVARALRPGGRFVFATAQMPKWTAPGRWLAYGFNAAMHVRNALVHPPFVMIYLTFTWPQIARRLVRHGLVARVSDVRVERPYERAIIVVATRDA